MQFTINPFTHRLDAFEQDLPGGGDVEFLTGNVGGAVSPNAAHNISLLGAGAVTTTGTPGTNTITFTVAGGGLIAWTREAGAAVPMVNNHGYFNTNAGLTTFTLPALAAVGDVIEVAGEGAGGWRIAQNALQSIQYGGNSTTIGIGGSLNSVNRYDTVRLVCRVANTTWSTIAVVGVPNAI